VAIICSIASVLASQSPDTSLLYSYASLTAVFFFVCSRHLRDLHSFPTRRSSDLAETTIELRLSLPTSGHWAISLTERCNRCAERSSILRMTRVLARGSGI